MSWQPPESDFDWQPPESDFKSQPQPEMAGSFPEAQAVLSSDASIPQKAWGMAQVPSQMAQRGLSQLSEELKPTPEYTGNMARDLVKNYPSFSADVLSKAAPGFISRGAMVAGGLAKGLQALRPIGSAIGQGIAGQLESATGANPGSLARAWNDPSRIFGAGKKAASPLYDAGKAELEQGTNLFKGMFDARQIVDKGKSYLDMGGKLEPAEALMYRKAIDAVGRGKNVIKDALVEMRGVADTAVKQSENMSEADKVFQRGLDSESLRRLLPSNKYGGTSAFKTGIMAAVPGAKYLLSPIVHGAVATAGGVASKVATSPFAAIAYKNFIDKFTTKDGQ